MSVIENNDIVVHDFTSEYVNPILGYIIIFIIILIIFFMLKYIFSWFY